MRSERKIEMILATVEEVKEAIKAQRNNKAFTIFQRESFN